MQKLLKFSLFSINLAARVVGRETIPYCNNVLQYNMVRRLSARQALRYLQDIEPDCSDGELSDSNDPWVNDAFPCTLASDEKSIVNDSSDEDSEDNDAVIDSDDSDDEMQDFVGKDGSLWQKLFTFQAPGGRNKTS